MSDSATHVDVEIVIPVHNEHVALEGGVRRLHGYLSRACPYSWRILIADGASTDGTLNVARRLMYELEHVEALRAPAAGLSPALRAGRGASDAATLLYVGLDHANSDPSALPAALVPRVTTSTARSLTFVSPQSRILSS